MLCPVHCVQVGMAAPVCVAMIAEEGGDKENTLSELYGGKGEAGAGATPLYEAIGDVSMPVSVAAAEPLGGGRMQWSREAAAAQPRLLPVFVPFPCRRSDNNGGEPQVLCTKGMWVMYIYK